MAVNEFDRWVLGWGRTAAFHLFQKHHTELNALYWAHAPAFRFTFAATRGKPETDHTSSLFALPADDARRINVTLGEWGANYDSFDNWVRLNAVVGATGYLEVYLKTIIRLALESDPGVLIGAPRGVDGVRLLKRNAKYNYRREVEACVRGTWGSRIGAYRRLFGHVPALLESSEGALDKLRITRNGVAHTFGRKSDDYDALVAFDTKPFERVRLKRLKKALGLIAKIALDVDEHLGAAHVGEYEALYFYHNWDRVYDRGQLSEDRALSKRFGKLYGWTRGDNYYRGIIAHYQNA